MKALRLAVAIPGIALLAWLGWTIIQVTRADALADGDPEVALEIDPDHARALLQLAREQLDAKDYDAATASARHVLRVEPGQGDAFAILALAAIGRGDANADELTRIALQRAPRDIDVRTQALLRALQGGDMTTAALQVDAMLRLSPRRGELLYPAMASQTMVPAFRQALLQRLALSPAWEGAFLRYVATKGAPEAVERIFGDLLEQDLLSSQQMKQWLDRQLREGHWRQAHDHWADMLDLRPGDIPLVYDGGFDADATGLGFDWRLDKRPGVFSTLETTHDGDRVAHFHFIGRPAPGGDLRQALLLSPGSYRIALRARGEFLHSEQGLEWVVRCEGGAIVATLGPLQGTFAWRQWTREFEVPSERCPGQWLELRNPAVRGSAQQVSGDLWIDDIAIAPVAPPPTPPTW